jgi:monofunctional biosynthetic peptidoglycan transglycosylase
MKEFLKKVWRFAWKSAMIFFILSILSVLLFRFVPVPFTPLMVIRIGEQVANGKSIKCTKDWVPIEKISKDMPLAVLCSEDQLFMEHDGFDMKAIEKALEYNDRKKGKRIRGGSTISQQTAKNVFLWQGRSWIRKGFEAYFTLLIEWIWSKERIMEVYLNVIEMGDGVYGSQAAAKEYFQVDAANLSASQAALIAAVLPNPRKWSPAHPTAYIIKKQQWILRQMSYHGGTINLEKEGEDTKELPPSKRKKG